MLMTGANDWWPSRRPRWRWSGPRACCRGRACCARAPRCAGSCLLWTTRCACCGRTRAACWRTSCWAAPASARPTRATGAPGRARWAGARVVLGAWAVAGGVGRSRATAGPGRARSAGARSWLAMGGEARRWSCCEGASQARGLASGLHTRLLCNAPWQRACRPVCFAPRRIGAFFNRWHRYYAHNWSEYRRQDSIDMMLGTYKVRCAHSSATCRLLLPHCWVWELPRRAGRAHARAATGAASCGGYARSCMRSPCDDVSCAAACVVHGLRPVAACAHTLCCAAARCVRVCQVDLGVKPPVPKPSSYSVIQLGGVCLAWALVQVRRARAHAEPDCSSWERSGQRSPVIRPLQRASVAHTSGRKTQGVALISGQALC